MAWIRSGTGGNSSAPVLLWTNSNPTSDFSAQTISVDLSNYEYILIKFKNTLNDGYTYETIFRTDNNLRQAIAGATSVSPSPQIYIRSFVLSSSQINFIDAYNCYNNGSGTRYMTKLNSLIIPIEIYGYKTI